MRNVMVAAAEDIIQYFESKNFEVSRSFSSAYSPEPVREVLKKVFQPQLSYKTIHIAGTVAKGSIAYLLSEMLISPKTKGRELLLSSFSFPK